MTLPLRLFDPEADAGYHEIATVGDVIDWFTANAPPSTSPTANAERLRILSLFKAEFGDSRYDKVIGADLVAFVNAHHGVKAANTVDRWYRTIKRPFCEAERLGVINRSPFKGVRSPKGKEGRDLTANEFRCLLRYATPAFRRVLIFLRFSGARPGELRNLEWCHVKLDAKVILLWQHKTVAKTNKPRRIYLNRVLVRLLIWLKRRSSSSFVFVNSFGGPWKTRALCKNLATIRERTALPSDVKLYGTRHAHATNAIMNGVDIATLAELLGHTSTRITQRYLHLSGRADHLLEAAEKAVKSHPTPTPSSRSFL